MLSPPIKEGWRERGGCQCQREGSESERKRELTSAVQPLLQRKGESELAFMKQFALEGRGRDGKAVEEISVQGREGDAPCRAACHYSLVPWVGPSHFMGRP